MGKPRVLALSLAGLGWAIVQSKLESPAMKQWSSALAAEQSASRA